jgi:hypothetical protein
MCMLSWYMPYQVAAAASRSEIGLEPEIHDQKAWQWSKNTLPNELIALVVSINLGMYMLSNTQSGGLLYR